MTDKTNPTHQNVLRLVDRNLRNVWKGNLFGGTAVCLHFPLTVLPGTVYPWVDSEPCFFLNFPEPLHGVICLRMAFLM